MGMQDYRKILESICARTPGWCVDEILRGNPVRTTNVPVWIRYFEPADLCRIVVDLGTLDQTFPSTLWRMMLESNCTNTSPFMPFLGINPADGHAILVMHLSMAEFRRQAQCAGFSDFLDGNLNAVTASWRDAAETVSNLGHENKPMPSGGLA
jgi:hypothetical protein